MPTGPVVCGFSSNNGSTSVSVMRPASTDPHQRSACCATEFGNDGFAADRSLADRDARRKALRQINIDARAEADEPEPLADRNGVFSSAQQTMRRATSPAICTTATSPLGLSIKRLLRSFSALALSRSAFRNLPGLCTIVVNPAAYRGAIDVAGKDVHEHGYPRHLLVAKTKFARRNSGPDSRHDTICRTDHQLVIGRALRAADHDRNRCTKR